MRHLTAIFAAVVMSASVFAQDTKPAAGAAALQGAWVITALSGKPSPEGSPAITLTFSGDKYEQAIGGEVNERGTIKVDGAKKPMTIDLLIAEGPDAGKTQLGIFEVVGNKLKASFDTPGAGKRPANFELSDANLVFEATKKP